MNPKLSIMVEVSPGSLIDDAAREAMALADRIGVTVDFKFNDVTCMAIPNGKASQIVKHYQEAQKSGNKFKYATSHDD